jgi:surface protein
MQMFRDASSFNQNIGGWNTASVSNVYGVQSSMLPAVWARADRATALMAWHGVPSLAAPAAARRSPVSSASSVRQSGVPVIHRTDVIDRGQGSLVLSRADDRIRADFRLEHRRLEHGERQRHVFCMLRSCCRRYQGAGRSGCGVDGLA